MLNSMRPFLLPALPGSLLGARLGHPALLGRGAGLCTRLGHPALLGIGLGTRLGHPALLGIGLGNPHDIL